MEIIVVIAWLALCAVAAWIASSKGRDAVGIFFLSLFLSPLVGLIVAAAISANPAEQGKKKCPKCAEYVQPDAKICRFCQHDFAKEEEAARLAQEEAHRQELADLEKRQQEEKERQEAYEAQQAALPWHTRSENRETILWVLVFLLVVVALLVILIVSLKFNQTNSTTNSTPLPAKVETVAETTEKESDPDWHVSNPTINPMSNVSTQFVTNGDAVKLVLCFSDRKPCAQGTVPVYVKSRCWIDGNEPGSYFRTIQVKFDDEKPTKEAWGITDDHKGLVPPRPRAFVTELNKHKAMMVEFGCDRSDQGDVTTLDIRDLQKTLDSANLKLN